MWLNVADNMWKLSDEELNAGVMAQMRDSAHAILYQIANSNAMNGISADAKVVSVTPLWKYMRIGMNIIAILTIYGLYRLTRLLFDRPPKKRLREWRKRKREKQVSETKKVEGIE